MTTFLFATAAILAFMLIVGAAADAWERHQSRARREGWRQHRAYMDSLEPKPWVRS